MNDSYNIGLKYLIDKYPKETFSGVETFDVPDNAPFNDILIELLLSQYNYGIIVKKELEDLLIHMEIIIN